MLNVGRDVIARATPANVLAEQVLAGFIRVFLPGVGGSCMGFVRVIRDCSFLLQIRISSAESRMLGNLPQNQYAIEVNCS